MKKMKQLFLMLALVALSINAEAQEKGDFSAFAGITYPLATGSEMGVNVGVEYMFTDKIAAAPSFSYYLYPSGLTTYAINVDGRYYLGGNDSFKYYGIAGGSLYKSTVTIPSIGGVGGGSVSSSAYGVNVGGGAIYNFNDSFGVIGQVKYTTNGSGFIEPSLGVNLTF